jgi:5'-methylthioadenosine phosphorylase
MEGHPRLAIIGGSGLYHMSGLAQAREIEADTPFGKPSAPIVVGELQGQRIAFLARHGIGHRLSPSEVPYRANIYALKALGVERIVSISACGSLREDYVPGEVVVPDQLFDFTRKRKASFFEDGLVAHISVANPFCEDLSMKLYAAVQSTGAACHSSGSLITIEGPRFSTKAESNTYRSWGMSIIGMTASPEAFLAREAEMCYAVMAHVTDYDVWHTSEEPVTVEMVIEILHRNTQIAQDAVRSLANGLGEERGCACASALASALITDPGAISAEARQRLSLLTGQYLK